jgi:hypothetical protein
MGRSLGHSASDRRFWGSEAPRQTARLAPVKSRPPRLRAAADGGCRRPAPGCAGQGPPLRRPEGRGSTRAGGAWPPGRAAVARRPPAGDNDGRTDQLRGPGPGGRTGHVQAAHTAERRRSGLHYRCPILPLRVLEPLFARSHSGVAAVVQVLSHEVPRHGDQISLVVGGYQKDGEQCSKLLFLLSAELHGASSCH